MFGETGGVVKKSSKRVQKFKQSSRKVQKIKRGASPSNLIHTCFEGGAAQFVFGLSLVSCSGLVGRAHII